MKLFGELRARGVFAMVLCLGLASVPGSVRAVSTTLVINEIDYDQPSTDTAEFLELKNVSSSPVNLDNYSVQLVNGNAGGAVLYGTIDLPNVDLAAGDYFVICANAANTPNCDLDVTPNTDLIQNGAPDAVGLLLGGVLVDAVSYEGNSGAPYTEGSGVGLVDNAAEALESISRCPDGTDSDQNNVDLILRPSTPGSQNNCPGAADVPPTVTSTVPANGATNVAAAANITINFSEAVTVSGAWFSIACVTSGLHSATVTGGPQTFTLNPDADFASLEACTVTVVAAQVVDQDGTPQNMAADFVFSFQTAQAFGACGDPATPIHAVQGSGASSPLNGTVGVIVEGIVVGDFQGTGEFGGFHLQEEDADADANPATSEGLFVFTGGAFPVSRGDKVRVRGRVLEFSSSGSLLTEITDVSALAVCSSGNTVTPTVVTLPVGALADWEAFEGMLVEIPQDLTVTENFTLGRFGEVALSVNGRLKNPTMVATPGAAANARQDLNDRSRILLDDGDNRQNIDPTLYPAGGLSALNTLRSGDVVHGLTGVLEQRFGVYRVQPIIPLSPDVPVAFDHANPRPAAPPAVGGRLRVAAMNVLNYFTTLDTGTPACGPAGTLDCRGANSAAELTRQRDKIVSAILGLDADVVGLMEVENNASAAIQDLVDGLNAKKGPGTYAFVPTGTIGTDAIKVGLLYKPAKVATVGGHAILDSTVDPTFIDTLNRPVLAQTLEELSTGARFTLAVAHLKSKGSDCNDVGDPDLGDGQGNCNLTRTRAATALVNWLATDPTGSGDPDFVIIGDLNSYAKEDPVAAIQAAGYVSLIDALLGDEAYSFVFGGQSGYLDHALASLSLAQQVTGATEWHVNADEPIALDYNLEFKSASQQTTLYDPGPYRASDHDPLVVGLDLTSSIQDTSPALLRVGLKNSDDQGTRFDVRVVLRVNGGVVAEGLTRCVTGIMRNPSSAKEVAVPFGPVAPNAFGPGDELSFEVLTRIGTNASGSFCGGHSNAVGLRLYYDALSHPSQFGAAIVPGPPTPFFLHSSGASSFFDATPPSAVPPKQKDSAGVAFSGGNPWKSVGTWSRVVP
jgi:predicted extracellular nuclease